MRPCKPKRTRKPWHSTEHLPLCRLWSSCPCLRCLKTVLRPSSSLLLLQQRLVIKTILALQVLASAKRCNPRLSVPVRRCHCRGDATQEDWGARGSTCPATGTGPGIRQAAGILKASCFSQLQASKLKGTKQRFECHNSTQT